MFTKKTLVGPLKLTIDITDSCDMHCIMCWYHSFYLGNDKNLVPRFFPLKRFEALIKELKAMHTKTVTLCAEGEPLLHPQIKEIVELCQRHALNIEIMTNAYYLDRENIVFFKKAGVKKIMVSLHSADSLTFEKIRPFKTKESFERIIENLLFLKHIKGKNKEPRLFIINAISSLNYQNVPDMAKLAEDLSASKVLFKPVSLIPGLPGYLELSKANKETLINSLIKLSKEINTANNIRSYLGVLHNNALAEGNLHRFKKKPPFSLCRCHIPWTSSVINIKGDVIGCVHSRGEILGNIFKSSFKDTWFGKKYNLFRKTYYCPKNCSGKVVYPLIP
ncbi:MAG: radical SAM protein [Candidatus Omnitrophica bacterium]|nr:radical SAM protein [Candidatus Omnitrophota bacterium]MBU1922956.1 radical SAM protein [Candidatus Omnitrophota bacterium]